MYLFKCTIGVEVINKKTKCEMPTTMIVTVGKKYF